MLSISTDENYLFLQISSVIGCKVTENIWNTQGFQQENANSFVFCAAKPCYLHKCADVISRWDGYAVSVPSTLHQIFNFFEMCKGLRRKSLRQGHFCLLSLGHRSVKEWRIMEGYKQGQGTHKTVSNKQKVMWSVIYINLTRTYINFCFQKVLIINKLQGVNINRGIWI